MLKDHAEWLIGHDQAMNEFREQGKALDERMARMDQKRREDNRDLDERIGKLVRACGWILRSEGSSCFPKLLLRGL
jgi:hypothetical protein